MLQATIVVLAFGVLLGLRFKALVLLPITLLILLLAGVAGLTDGVRFSAVLLSGLLAAVKLQIGYVLGLGVRHLVQLTRPHHIGSNRKDISNETESHFSW